MKPSRKSLPSNCAFELSPVARVTVDSITVVLGGPLATLMSTLMEHRGRRIGRGTLASAIRCEDMPFTDGATVGPDDVDVWMENLRAVLMHGGITLTLDTDNPRFGYGILGMSTPSCNVRFSPRMPHADPKERSKEIAQPLSERPVYRDHNDVPWAMKNQTEERQIRMRKKEESN